MKNRIVRGWCARVKPGGERFLPILGFVRKWQNLLTRSEKDGECGSRCQGRPENSF